MPEGHPDLAALEAEPPPPELQRHLDACARCRVERRLLRAGRPAGAPAHPDAGGAPGSSEGAPPAWHDQGSAFYAPTSSVRSDRRPRRRGPRYALGARLGAGATAEVRRAFDPSLGRHVALKLLRPGRVGGRARFFAEARITARLDHPNIVPVHHLGRTSRGRPYVAMREVHGMSLGESVRSGRIAELGAGVDALRKVCAAIAYAHHCGVVHRDLKPDNVMIGEFGEVLVVDWGLALELGAGGGRREAGIAGTPAWMAPEQARGEIAALSVRTDVYALGAILFFLATKRPPVQATDPATALDLVAKGRVPSPRDLDRRVPREIDAIVRRAMSFDADRRYPDVRSLLEDLDAWREHRALPHVGSRLGERVEKALVRNRGAVRAVVLTGMLGVGLAGLGGWRYLQDVRAARDRAAAEADRARDAERRVALGEARARVALADAARLDGRARDAADELAQAANSLGAMGGDLRNLEMARAALHRHSPPPLARCQPLDGAPVQAVAVAPDGSGALALGADGRLARWDPADCRAQGEDAFAAIPVESAVAWLEDGPAAVAWVGAEIVQHRPGQGEVARIPLPEAFAGGPGGREGVARLSLTPWGEAALVAADGRWWSFRFGEAALRPETRWPQAPAYLTLVPGGTRVFASPDPADAGRGALWDRRSLQPVRSGWYSFRPPGDARLALVDSPMGPVGVDLGTGTVRWATGESRYVGVGGVPGGRLATVARPGSALVYKLEGGEVIARFVLPADWEEVCASRDARLLLAWGRDGSVSTWLRPASIAPPVEAPAASSPVVRGSPDGRLLAVAGAAAFPGVEVFDLSTRVRLYRLPAGGMVHGLAFSPDGASLAATLRGGGRVRWSLVGGAETWRERSTEESLPLAWVGEELVSVDAEGGLLVLDEADGRQLRRFPVLAGPSWDLAAVAGTRRVVVGAFRPGTPSALLVDIDQGTVLQRLDRHAARAQVAVAPDGSFAALAGWDGRTVIWDLETGEVRRELDAVIGPTIGTDVSPDGSLVVTAGFDKQLSFWDVATGERLRTSALDRTGSRVVFGPSGSVFVVRSGWSVSEVPLDAHLRFRTAIAGLAGGPRARARAFAALGWWERVLGELDRGEDEPELRVQAWLAAGRPEEAARVARSHPDRPYLRIVGAHQP